MFEGIPFTSSNTTIPLTSRLVQPDQYDNARKYSKNERENLSNSDFYISGSCDSFLPPPIADFAVNNLYYLQSFVIFHYQKGSYTRRQDYHSFLILYTYSGTGTVEYEGKTYTLHEGDGVFLDCLRPHYYKAETDWDVATLHFNSPLAEYFHEEYLQTRNLVFHEKTDERFHRYLEQLLNIYNSPSLQRDLRASHCLEGIVLHLLVLCSNMKISKKDVPEAIQTVISYMENHYEQNLTLDKMAEMTNTSKYHFSKQFKRYTGFSPHDYLITIRLKQAKILLKTTSLPASKISHMVGIHDINNFNYLFKKKIGKTPIQYRNAPDIIL